MNVTDNGLTVTGVELTIGSTTYSDTAAPFRFSSLDASAIPLTGTGTALVRVGNGRNQAVAVTDPGASVAVIAYQTLDGSVTDLPTGARVRATPVAASCGTPCPGARTVTVRSGGNFPFSGANGLDVNDDGSDLDWRIELVDAMNDVIAGSTSADVTVDATTATNPDTPTVAGP